MNLGSQIIRQRQSLRNAMLRVLDAVSIVIGLVFSLRAAPEADSDSTLVTCLASIGLFSLVAEFTALYRDWQAVSLKRELTCLVTTWSIALAGLAVLGRFSESTTEITGWSLVIWFIVTPTTAVLARFLVRRLGRYLIDRGVVGTGYAVVGVNELGVRLVRNVAASPELGLKFVGFYDDRPARRTEALPDDLNYRLGNISELIQHARSGRISKIFITLPMRAERRIREVLDGLSDTTASVYVVPDFFVFELLHSRWTDIQGIPAVSIFENPFYGVDGMLKRICDLSLASLAVVLLSPLMAVIALLVKLSSPGPVLFKQRRYGLDGREIQVWKFRSMTVCENGSEVRQATRGDARVTRLGAILRRTSLDELPQLFNVLGGSMSLVGPRPHATAHNEEYRRKIAGYMLRHKVKPGITGLAQVSGWRGETETLEKMRGRIECDHRYIRDWSVWLDLQILIRTITVVLSRQNAY